MEWGMTQDKDIADNWPNPTTAPSSENNSQVTPENSTASSGVTELLPPENQEIRQFHDSILLENVNTPEKKVGLWPISATGRLRWLNSWLFWLSVMTIFSSGVGLTAIALLLKLPAVPNCPAIFWPTASVSLRLYCGELAANKQTVNDLLEAIALVKDIEADHPLRSIVNNHIKQWTQDIFDLGEKEFQAGNLSDAIDILRKIPTDAPDEEAKRDIAKMITDKINYWQSIWSKAEDIYQEAEKQIDKENWPKAFKAAVRLLDVGNKYWATNKYQEINELIESARSQDNQLNKARELADAGGLKNLLAAIKEVEKIDTKSKVYQTAQKLIKKFGRRILDLAENALDKQDWQGAMAIAREIPESAKLQEEVEDMIELARAQSTASMGMISSLDSAIKQIEKMPSKRPLYSKAQQLISRWQRQKEEIAYLDQARTLARGGTVNDLSAAINKAQLISNENPTATDRDREVTRWNRQMQNMQDQPSLERAEQLASFGDINSLQAAIAQANQITPGRYLYQEAQDKIQMWSKKIQSKEDRPYLDRAEQLAILGDANSLQGAIDEANRIRPGRAIYQEAQERIQAWKKQLQNLQDRPTLEQARTLANQGNLPEAINKVEKISSGRSLSDEARSDMENWRSQLQSQQLMDEARRLAAQGTPEALVAAIRKVDNISNSSRLRVDAEAAISGWSQQILAQAQQRSATDIPGAIAIAEQVPSNSPSYSAARDQIQVWKQFLNFPKKP